MSAGSTVSRRQRRAHSAARTAGESLPEAWNGAARQSKASQLRQLLAGEAIIEVRVPFSVSKCLLPVPDISTVLPFQLCNGWVMCAGACVLRWVERAADRGSRYSASQMLTSAGFAGLACSTCINA